MITRVSGGLGVAYQEESVLQLVVLAGLPFGGHVFFYSTLITQPLCIHTAISASSCID